MEPTEPMERNKNLNSRKREEPYDRADKQEVTLMHAMRKSNQKQLDKLSTKNMEVVRGVFDQNRGLGSRFPLSISYEFRSKIKHETKYKLFGGLSYKI